MIFLDSSFSSIPYHLPKQIFKNKSMYGLYQLHHVDGLTLSGVKQLLAAKDNLSKDLLTLTGSSGRIWGVVRILA